VRRKGAVRWDETLAPHGGKPGRGRVVSLPVDTALETEEIEVESFGRAVKSVLMSAFLAIAVHVSGRPALRIP